MCVQIIKLAQIIRTSAFLFVDVDFSSADCKHFLKLLGEKKEKGYLAAIMGNLAVSIPHPSDY